MQSHVIIEKTAKFIAEQVNGNQMEIILKAKQATNSKFDFLGYNNELNPYYKHLVEVIKNGKYKPVETRTVVEESDDTPSHGDNNVSGSDEDCDANYLHPSLLKTSTETVPNVSKITYKLPTTNSTYSILVSKMQGAIMPHQEQQQSQSAIIDSWPVQKEETREIRDPRNVAPVIYGITGVPIRQPYEIPSSQDQLIIEKLASYVVKNGSDFEDATKTKGDPRFAFLDTCHNFHWYYLNCKARLKAEQNAVVASGSFLSYSKGKPEPIKTSICNSGPGPGHTSSLPLSAAGIPIANNASIHSRPSTISAELVSRVEEILKKKAFLNKADSGKLPCDNSTSISNAFLLASATAQRILKRDSNPVIKFSPSLSQPPLVINDNKEKDVSSNSDSGNHTLPNANRKDDEMTPEELERKRKEERRRKASLFLETIKNRNIVAQKTETENNARTSKHDATEVHSDVEIATSPKVLPEDMCKENEAEKLPDIKTENEVLDLPKLPPDSCDTNNSAKSNLGRKKKRSSKRSLSSSSLDSSPSDIRTVPSASSSSKKKRCKRKHLKNRKEEYKRTKDKSKSRSKTSKRHNK